MSAFCLYSALRIPNAALREEMQHPKLEDLVRRDPRYAYEAYEFVFGALAHAQKMLGRESSGEEDDEVHVSGPELLAGVRDLALREFGLLARTVFRLWGVNATDDFGEIVFNLIEAGLMSKNEEDTRRDFHAVYDLDEALVQDYRIELEPESEEAP
jgi:uncharacterized repeat protein (TIGR04138 family)